MAQEYFSTHRIGGCFQLVISDEIHSPNQPHLESLVFPVRYCKRTAPIIKDKCTDSAALWDVDSGIDGRFLHLRIAH